MKKIVLIDGNNLLYRSYYATAYNGNLMKNSKGFPTNALYGFINMLNKIIEEEKPTHIMVAFDKGKTFRHDKYEVYKGKREETPKELKDQFPLAKELTLTMGIKYYEIDNYEADDIIGTLSQKIDNSDDYLGLIVSSDKDLLQLISNKVKVKLLKTHDYIMMDRDELYHTYGLEPKGIIDLKSLMGDASDNIPGVKGIGEKTALNLLHEYHSLNGVYENIDNIKGKLQEKLINDKENAYLSYEIATIYQEVPIDTNLENIKYMGLNYDKYIAILNDLEFYSLLKKIPQSSSKPVSDNNYEIIQDLDNLQLQEPYSIYTEAFGYNYHDAILLGVTVTTSKKHYYIPVSLLENSNIFCDSLPKYTYDLKKLLVLFHKHNIKIDGKIDDLMIEAYLLNKNIKNDISYLANQNNYDIPFYDKEFGTEITLKMPEEQVIEKNMIMKSQFIYDVKDKYLEELQREDMLDLYTKMELPLVYVLTKMEINGFKVDKNYLINMGEELQEKINKLSEEIYIMANTEFNISSPKQLGDVLFKKLMIPYPKRIKDDNYSTSKDILDKLSGKYAIVDKVLLYRTYTKLYSNYIVGLINEIKSDHKIHTIFNQTLTRTGRLSSERPNLQNIPIRLEEGRLIRKAFIPSNDSIIVSSDYSQIELRVFAHMSKAANLESAFLNDLDIHTKTAADIFKVDLKDVTKSMRRSAKAVNFGILYGISSFGLSSDLNINVNEAKAFIDNYLETFPGIKDYMNNVIKEAHEKGYVETLFKRKRIIDELNNKNYIIRSSGERMALNTPIQGTAADILKLAMIKIDQELDRLNLNTKMLVQVHDELVFDVPKNEVEIVSKMIKDVMENIYHLSVPLKVDIEYGNTWYEAK